MAVVLLSSSSSSYDHLLRRLQCYSFLYSFGILTQFPNLFFVVGGYLSRYFSGVQSEYIPGDFSMVVFISLFLYDDRETTINK